MDAALKSSISDKHQHQYRPVRRRPAFADFECVGFGWCDRPDISKKDFIATYGIMGSAEVYVGKEWDFRAA